MSSSISVIIKSLKVFESFLKESTKTEQFSNVIIYIDEIPEEKFKQLGNIKRKIQIERVVFRLTGDHVETQPIFIPECFITKQVSFSQEDPKKLSKISISSQRRSFENIQFIRVIVDSCDITGNVVSFDAKDLCEIDQKTFRNLENMTKYKLILKNATVKSDIERNKDIKVCYCVNQDFDDPLKCMIPKCCDSIFFNTSGIVDLILYSNRKEIHSINFYSQHTTEDRQKVDFFDIKEISKLSVYYDPEDVESEEKTIKTFFLSFREQEVKVNKLSLHNVPNITLRLDSIDSLKIDNEANGNQTIKIFADPVTIQKILIRLDSKTKKILLFCKHVRDIFVVSKELENIKKCQFLFTTEHDIDSLNVRYKTTDSNDQNIYSINLKSKKNVKKFSIKQLQEDESEKE
jgi:hypothetical protein